MIKNSKKMDLTAAFFLLLWENIPFFCLIYEIQHLY